jgi:hypothetical protein
LDSLANPLLPGESGASKFVLFLPGRPGRAVSAWPPQGPIACENAGAGFCLRCKKARYVPPRYPVVFFASVCGHCPVPCSGGGSSSSTSSTSPRSECCDGTSPTPQQTHHDEQPHTSPHATKNTASARPVACACCYIHGGHSPTSALRPGLFSVLQTKLASPNQKTTAPRDQGTLAGGGAGGASPFSRSAPSSGTSNSAACGQAAADIGLMAGLSPVFVP